METWPRQHRNRIILLPRAEGKDAILDTVPAHFQNMVREHLNDYVFKSRLKKAKEITR